MTCSPGYITVEPPLADTNERNMLRKHRPTFWDEGCAMLNEGVQTISTSLAMLRETYTARKSI